MKLRTNKNKHEGQLYNLSLIKKMCRGNEKQIEKMIQAFMRQTSRSILELKFASAENDFLKIRAIDHKIKPSFTYFGSVKLENEVKVIEALFLGELEIVNLQSRIDILMDLVHQVISKMKNDFKL
jgi:HPt (histidine-containing phosphotransfer) domain-containing protein